MSNLYAPNEPSALIKLEHIAVLGQVFICISYGVFATIGVTTLYFLLRKPRGTISWSQVAYVVALLIGATFYVGPQTKFFMLMFVDDRNFPGGPASFFASQFSRPSAVIAEAAFIVNNFLADGMILYRTYLIYNFNWLVIIFPALWFMASTGLSIITLDQSSRPDSSLFAKSSFNFAVPYFSLSMGLNIFLTLLIVIRLYVARRNLRGALGSQHTGIYASVSAMIVESAAIYSITSLLFIVLYAIGNPFSDIFLGILSQTMCIGPTLIILRVTYGRGISKGNVVATASKMQWRSPIPTTGQTGTAVALGMSIDRTITKEVTSSAYELKPIDVESDSFDQDQAHAV